MTTTNIYLQPAAVDEELCFASVEQLAAGLVAGSYTSHELTQLFLNRIERLNGELNAYVTLLPEAALVAADESDRRRQAGEPRGVFDGLPVSVKDVEPMKGVRYTAGLLPLKDNVADVDALHTERLKEAGAVILGKTNTPELGHKATTDNMLFGPTRNPYRTETNAGGSSGGAAASVAAGLAVVGQGSDGGGSIRIPAAMTGIVGFKASAFAIPDVIRPDGFAAIAPFTHIGPLARSVADAVALTRLLARPSRRDPLSAPLPEAASRPLAETRIGFDLNFGNFPVDGEVVEIVTSAANVIATHSKVEELTVEDLDHAESVALEFRLISTLYASIADRFARDGIDLLKDHRDEIPDELAELIERGSSTSAVEFRRDNAQRTEVFDAIETAFETVDIIMTPTLAISEVPNDPRMGRTIGPDLVNGRPIEPTLGWCLTYPTNLSGHPAISIPAGYTRRGMPVGLQLIARRWEDWSLTDLAGTISEILAVPRVHASAER